MTTTTQQKPQRNPSFLAGILPINRGLVSSNIIAGITLAALAIPEVMGYTKIAGMPVVTGLYTILISMAPYALFGASRHLVVGADSATAAIMAAGLAGLATTASPEYIAYAGILALMAAFFLFLARLIKLGSLADFLSQTVLIDFITGVGIQVAIVLSLLIHTRHGYQPKNSVLEVDTTGKPHMVPVSEHTQAIQGLMIYRFHHSAYYANAELLSQEVLDLVNTAQPLLAWFWVDATAMDDIDFSAAATLRELYYTLKEKGVRLVLAEVSDSVRTQLERSELIDLVGKDAIYKDITDTEDSFRTAQANRKQ